MAERSPTLKRTMTGNVNGAVRMSFDHVGRFGGTIPELGILVVDLCYPENSLSSYWVSGTAISHLYASSLPVWLLQPKVAKDNSDAKAWCGDLEPDIGSRLPGAQLALRSAMVTVLGPDAWNDKSCLRRAEH